MKVEHIYRRQNDGRTVPVTIYSDKCPVDDLPVCGSIHGHYSASALETIVGRLREMTK
jgi:hypothetical protein